MFAIELKKRIFLLFCMCLFSTSLLWAQETEIPLPADAVQTLENSFIAGPTKSYMKSYVTSFSRDKLNAFFNREMIKAGWSKKREGFFMKNSYLAVITIVNLKAKDNNTRFSVVTSRMPSKEEILAERKAKPDKVNFMPVYPGSVQNFLWDLPTGASASYETDAGIKEVVFFYKSGMLNYGWSLYSETPVKTEEINCPECKKTMDLKGSSSMETLIFRRNNGESCIIRLYQGVSGMQENPADVGSGGGSSSKTTILATYNAKKKINQ